MSSTATGRVAFILKGYPRLSETFIAQEIAALERRGLDILQRMQNGKGRSIMRLSQVTGQDVLIATSLQKEKAIYGQKA